MRPIVPGDPSASRMLYWLRRLIPVFMGLVIFAGIGAGLRLASYLGEPFAGFPFIWRKEYKLYTVGWMTPSYWSGMHAGLRVNDRILCINAYTPKFTEIYGLDEHYPKGYSCPSGVKNFAEIFREVYKTNASPEVHFLIDRGAGEFETVKVPLVPFNINMMFDILLPLFLVGLGLLVVGWVIFRTNPNGAPNLYFAFLLTIVASFVMNQIVLGVYSDQLEETRYWTLLMVIPWIPMLGSVSFNLFELLTRPGPLSRVATYVRKPFAYLSILFSALGIFNYVFSDQAITYGPTWLYNFFMATSFSFGAISGLVGFYWSWRHGAARRIQVRSQWILVCLVVAFSITTPFIYLVFAPGNLGSLLQHMPYFGLGIIAFVVYVILRYQLFAVKTRTLINLLLILVCTIIAYLIHSILGNANSLIPIWVGAVLTGLMLEGRRGPFGWFDRFLRREIMNYQVVVRFNKQTGGLLNIGSLIQAAGASFSKELNIDKVEFWLRDDMERTWQYFVNGELCPLPRGLSFGLLESGLTDPTLPVSPESSKATLETFYGPASTPGASLWLPLMAREQAIGILRLGERRTGEIYNEDDLSLVTILANQLSLSIANTYQYERLQTMQRRILQAEENERNKVARELHDTVLQFLLVLNYGLDDLKDRTGDLTTEIEVWQDRISTEAGQLRDLLGYLRSPEILVRHGLIPSLQSWINQIRMETQIPLEVELDQRAGDALSGEAQIALYRVFREAIHNAIKHSHAQSIWASLKQVNGQIRFEIRDDGAGFDLAEKLEVADKPYRSLQDMVTYIESAGGHLDIDTAPGSGTSIRGTFPIK